jgi:hypothetical protein
MLQHDRETDLALFFSVCSGLPLRERIGAPIAILVLLLFLGIGIDTVINPSRHMNAYLRRGGDMLRDINQMQVRMVGLLFSVVAGVMLIVLIEGVWSDCLS